MDKRERVLATLCYVKSQSKTLMLHRVKKEKDEHFGKWNGLGGKLEPGETPEECAIREVREESGLIAKALELRGILTFPEFANNRDWYVFVFVITDIEGELIESTEGNLEWIDDAKIFELNLWEGDKIFMKWLAEKKFFSAKFVYENGKYVEHSVAFYKF